MRVRVWLAVDTDAIRVINRSTKYRNKFVHRRQSACVQVSRTGQAGREGREGREEHPSLLTLTTAGYFRLLLSDRQPLGY